jgi:glycosyltransferase involved in cell wall biosynthesis
MEHLPLSVTIISFNEEDNIKRTLESVKDIASEIIVVDSHSTDKTREIAKSYHAKIYEEDWRGFIYQKNSAFDKCTLNYILSVDCDEVVSRELKESITRAVKNQEAEGFFVNRKTYYLGKFLEHTWQPEWRLRLVKKSANPRWEGYDPHGNILIPGKTKRIKGDLYHYSYKNIEDHFNRALAYARISAKAYHKMGRRFKIYNLPFNPLFAFIKTYFIKCGFLDGIRGFSVGASVALSTFLKYLYLWEMENRKTTSKVD